MADDILIFSHSPEENHQHVRQVLQRLLENRFFVKPEKCELNLSSQHFLGYIIAKEQLQPDPVKIQAVISWPIPSTRKELQRFIGLANFYRRFIRDYSKVADLLTSLTSTSSPFHWTPVASQAFERLQELFTSSPILRQPDPSLQFVVDVDASDTGDGADLSQQDPESPK
ncbi:uncharacterized protein LOC133485210 [Phyllopteryx taeniolatus]|uniref:uncharacterized protein LOC133485210 n=1 Tax=Phyllopteryx taeniolatus TaxID=161469 RepID=UPI002AD2EBAB|nr:uncharacterized protein LOC133485210 [Phyllopteryx taeniolatus]